MKRLCHHPSLKICLRLLLKLICRFILTRSHAKFLTVLKANGDLLDPKIKGPFFEASDIYVFNSLSSFKDKHVRFLAGSRKNDNIFQAVGFDMANITTGFPMVMYLRWPLRSKKIHSTGLHQFNCGLKTSNSTDMILRAEHLVKKYKTRTVVNDVSVQVKQGEIVGLLGPNGAGKTTSFYMMVGLIKPNEGRIFLDDEEITPLPMYQRARKGIGYLAQEASVFRKLTVEENIMSVLKCANSRSNNAKKK